MPHKSVRQFLTFFTHTKRESECPFLTLKHAVEQETPQSKVVRGIEELRTGLFPPAPSGSSAFPIAAPHPVATADITHMVSPEMAEPQESPPHLALVTASFVGGKPGEARAAAAAWRVESLSSQSEDVQLLKDVAALRGAEVVDRERELKQLNELVREQRAMIEGEREAMRAQMEHIRRQAQEETAVLAARTRHAEEESSDLKLEVQLLRTSLSTTVTDGGQGGGAERVQEMMRRATEAEYEKALLERQVGQLQQSLAETSQTFAMLQVRSKEAMLQSAQRRIQYRQLARILAAWSELAVEARRGEQDNHELREGCDGGDAQIKVMEDWIKDLTTSLEALRRENLALRCHYDQLQHAQEPPSAAPGTSRGVGEGEKQRKGWTRSKDCRSWFENWRCWTSTARSSRRGVLQSWFDIWRERCPDMCDRQPTLRERDLRARVAQLEQDLGDARLQTVGEQESSEKLVFLLTDKQQELDTLRADLLRAQEALAQRGNDVDAERRECLAGAEAKVLLLEEHVSEMGKREAGVRRQLEDKSRDCDRLRAKVEELQAQVQQARVREKIWVLETSGGLADSGRRGSGVNGEGLRGVRLLCLEKAYIFTQCLARAHGKRLLLRILYCWAYYADSEQEERAALQRAQKDQATWTETPEKLGEVELATKLSICRERVHALEAKVEELQAVNLAYSQAAMRVATSSVLSPLRADSTIASLSSCGTSTCFDRSCNGPVDGQSPMRHCGADDGEDTRVAVADCVISPGSPVTASEKRARHVLVLAVSNVTEGQEDSAIAAGAGAPHAGVSAGGRHETLDGALAGTSPLVCATSDWNVSSPQNTGGKESASEGKSQVTRGGVEDGGILAAHDSSEAQVDPKQSLGLAASSVSLYPASPTGPAAPADVGDAALHAGKEASAMGMCAQEQSPSGVVSQLPNGACWLRTECSPSAAHLGHTPSEHISDPGKPADADQHYAPAIAMENTRMPGRPGTSRLRAPMHQAAGAEAARVHPVTGRGKDDLADGADAEEDTDEAGGAVSGPTPLQRSEGGCEGEESEGCVTPRTMLLIELHALSNSLSRGACPAGPMQLGAGGPAATAANASAQGVTHGLLEVTDHPPRVAADRLQTGAQGGGKLTPKRMENKSPSKPPSNVEGSSHPAGTGLARISAMPNPFTGSPSVVLREAPRNGRDSRTGTSRTRRKSQSAGEHRIKGLMWKSTAIFASPNKSQASEPTSYPSPGPHSVLPCDPSAVESRFFDFDSRSAASQSRAWKKCDVWNQSPAKQVSVRYAQHVTDLCASPTGAAAAEQCGSPGRDGEADVEEDEFVPEHVDAGKASSGCAEEKRQEEDEAEASHSFSVSLSPIAGAQPRFQVLLLCATHTHAHTHTHQLDPSVLKHAQMCGERMILNCAFLRFSHPPFTHNRAPGLPSPPLSHSHRCTHTYKRARAHTHTICM